MRLRYGDNDELCHEPSGDPWWQESAAFDGLSQRSKEAP